MSKANGHDKGSFCWFEVLAKDVEAAKGFFGKVLAWDYHEMEMPGGMPPYHLIQLGGEDIGGMYELPSEMRKAEVPPHVLGYIAVEDVEAAVKRVPELGGTVQMGVMDVMDKGRMAMIAGPEGAAVCLWQALSHTGTQLSGREGVPCWHELNVRDAKKAAIFYADLLDLEVSRIPFPDPNMEGEYTILGRGGDKFFGILQMTEEWGDMPSSWMTYFQVDSAGEAVKRVESGGGKVPYGVFTLPGIGDIGVVEDPQGIYFTIMQPVSSD